MAVLAKIKSPQVVHIQADQLDALEAFEENCMHMLNFMGIGDWVQILPREQKLDVLAKGGKIAALVDNGQIVASVIADPRDVRGQIETQYNGDARLPAGEGVLFRSALVDSNYGAKGVMSALVNGLATDMCDTKGRYGVLITRPENKAARGVAKATGFIEGELVSKRANPSPRIIFIRHNHG